MRGGGQDGWALVSVLWVVAILSLLAVTLQSITLVSRHMEVRARERGLADAILQAATDRAVLGIDDPRIGERWRVDGGAQKFFFEGIETQIRIEDELGKIDLNAADGSMIDRLLQSAGLTVSQSDQLTNRIVDWRSSSGVHDGRVPTNADYAAAGKTYHIRHGAFQSVAELNLVLGMTPELFAKIAPALTVYTGRPAFDPTYAPEEALRALYLHEPNKVTEALDNRRYMSASGELGSHPGVLSTATVLAGRAFTIDAELHIGKNRYTRHTVVMLTGDAKRPYFFMAWQ